jgi:hypothetical protein
VLALADRRESLARLRADPSVAVVILAAGNVALTAYGTAEPLEAPMPDGVVAVRVLVERVQDHRQRAFVIEAGVRWRWTDVGARERDAQVQSALARIASHTSDV